MKIDVKKVARLASLPLTSQEEEKYSKQLSKILDYIEQLNKVDTSKVEPIFNVSGSFDKLRINNVMRDDELGECLPQNEALLDASQKKRGFFSTKKIFDNE